MAFESLVNNEFSSLPFPGDPVAKTPHSQCKGPGFNPGGGTGSCMPQLRSQHAATKRAHVFMTLAKHPKWASTRLMWASTWKRVTKYPRLSTVLICCDSLSWAFDPEERWSSRSWPSVSQRSMQPWGPVSDSHLTVPQHQEEGACRGPLGASQSHTSPRITEADLCSRTTCLRNALASELSKTDLRMWNTFSISLLLGLTENVCVNFLQIVAFEV